MGLYSLSAAERLKSRKAIELLFEKGASLYKHPLKVIYSIREADVIPVAFACSVSKRKFRNAVDRNRIKRLIREAFRLDALALRENCLRNEKRIDLIFIFTGSELPDFELLRQSMSILLKQLTSKI
jgi:ribonuclease P protein component